MFLAKNLKNGSIVTRSKNHHISPCIIIITIRMLILVFITRQQTDHNWFRLSRIVYCKPLTAPDVDLFSTTLSWTKFHYKFENGFENVVLSFQPNIVSVLLEWVFARQWISMRRQKKT